jgi:rubredoxin
MGRKKEFKVQKAFTIGAKEIMWAQEKAEGQGLKLSTYIHTLIKQAMLIDLNKAVTKPSTWCTSCNAYRGFDNIKGKWLCEECNDDKTEVIKYSLR